MDAKRKPWDNDDVILERRWMVSSNHRGGPVKDHTLVEALVLIQDGNMGGNYVRVIAYVKDQKETSFSIYRANGHNNPFYFDKPVKDMEIGDVLVNQANGHEYMVTRKPDEKYYRVLESTQQL